jgi:hypothetical protein
MLMSLRLFASQHLFTSKHLAALVLAGLVVGATPATAGGLYGTSLQTTQYYSGSCGGCGSSYVQQPQYYTSSCGGCATTYVAPQPQYYSGSCGGCGYTAPQPTYYSGSCGGCGNTYAPQPVAQPQYGDDGGYVTRPYRYGYTGYRGYRYRSYYGRRAFRY